METFTESNNNERMFLLKNVRFFSKAVFYLVLRVLNLRGRAVTELAIGDSVLE